MTLDNLQYALYLNNCILLDKIKAIKNIVDDNMSNDTKELKELLEELDTDLSNHTNDTVIHVTQEDKNLWNATLQNAKDYAKILFDSITSFTIEIVDALPTENINSMTIYFMRNDHNNESDYYDEYMYIHDRWEVIGSTFINLTPYLLKEDFEKYQQEIIDKFAKYNTSDEISNILKDYLSIQTFSDTIKDYITIETLQKLLEEYAKIKDIHTHDNKDIIDKLSESTDGNLLFNGQEIKGGSDSNITVSEEDNNAIQQKDDGIFVEDKTEQIDSIQEQVNKVSIAQKTVNAELDYFYGETVETNTLNYSSSDCPIIIKYNQKENSNIEYDFSTGILKLKANKTYKISIEMRFSLSSGGGQISYRVYKKDGTILSPLIGVKNSISNNTNLWSDKDYDLIITTKEDMEIYACIYKISLTDSSIKLISIQSSVSIQEIGRQVVIDPVEYINSSQGIEDTPVGHIISHMGNTAPKHYLICDGTEYNISDCPYLAQHFKDEFGSYNYFGGDGINTFCIPDLRGEFLRGTGENSRENQGSGANVGEHQDATKHVHTSSGGADNQILWPSSKGASPKNMESSIDYRNSLSNVFGYNYSNNTNYFTYYTSRPTNTSVLYCIKYEPTYYMTVGEYTVQGFEDYSKEEKIIGKWIDGRPLYRKTIVTATPSVANQWVVVATIEKNITVVNIKGILILSNVLSYAVPGSRNCFVDIVGYNNSGNIGIMTVQGLYSIPTIITVEYTKSADAENSFTTDMLSTIVMSGNKQEDLTEKELNNLITDTINLLNE